MRSTRRLAVTVLAAAGFFLFPKGGLGCVWDVCDIRHITYIFSHANIFHLLANLVCVWGFRKEINHVAWITAVLVSFLPSFSSVPVVGMSGLLFAHLGTTWAPSRQLKPMCRKILPWAILWGLLPGVCLPVHIYALFGGYLLQLLNDKIKTR